MNKSLTVVGGGQMGRALVGGMLSQAVLTADQIRLVDPDPQCQEWWREHHDGVTVSQDLTDAVSKSDSVLLAVKPNLIPVVTKQRGRFWSGKLVISIAAGISLEQLCGWIGHKRVIRVMPNTPCLVGAGACAFCGAADVTSEDETWIESMLASVGLVVRVSENQMDGVTGLSGSGPAYVCLIIEALADGGVLAGLPRDMAMKLATQTVRGTAKMVEQTQQHPGQLKDAVASPGGTTIAAIATLERHGVRGALMEAVAASAKRSMELGD
jgi:pyrroline-5-carboxylate reductase